MFGRGYFGGGYWGAAYWGGGTAVVPVITPPQRATTFGGSGSPIRPRFKKPKPEPPSRTGRAKLFLPVAELHGDGFATRPMVTGNAKPLNLRGIGAKGEAGVAYLIDTASLIAQDNFLFGLKG